MTLANEPVVVAGAFNTAVLSTIAILLYFKIDPHLVAAISASATGWIMAIASVVRGKVTPIGKPTPPSPLYIAGPPIGSVTEVGV